MMPNQDHFVFCYFNIFALVCVKAFIVNSSVDASLRNFLYRSVRSHLIFISLNSLWINLRLTSRNKHATNREINCLMTLKITIQSKKQQQIKTAPIMTPILVWIFICIHIPHNWYFIFDSHEWCWYHKIVWFE